MQLRRVIAKARRGRLFGQGLALALVLTSCFVPLAGAEASGTDTGRREGIEVGSISTLDLDAVRRIIDASDDAGAPSATVKRALGLEESVKTALEYNLDIQIIDTGVQAGELEIDKQKSRFHPTGIVEGGATGTKFGVDNLEGILLVAPQNYRLPQFSDSQKVGAFVNQEVGTGGDVTVGLGYSRTFRDEFLESVTPGGASGNVQTTQEIAGFSISLRQPLLKGGRIYVARREILNAEYDDQMNRADLRAQMLKVTAETKTAYYQVVRALRQIEVVEQALARDQELIDSSQALFDAGRVSKVDVLSADISLSNNKARLASTHAQHETAQNGLRSVLGLPVNVEIEILDRTIPFHPVRIELDQWIRTALDNRPEIMRLRTELEKSELATRVSKNARLPTLDVEGGYDQGADWKSYNWNAGLTFRYQLGNVGGKSQYKQARLQNVKLNHELARKKRDVELEVREIEIRLRESVQRLKNITIGVQSARAKGEIARGRFEMGLANNLDITNADEELVQAESALLEALVDYASNLAELEARIGGQL